MATATKNKEPVTLDQLHEPPQPAVNITAHEKDLARRAAEREARCSLEERLRLCSPRYAQERELKKPIFRWKIEFVVVERGKKETAPKDKYADNYADDEDDGVPKLRTITKHADAQDEATAWAKVCDSMGEWPSPKLAKPRFTKLKQVKL